ncbi:unnamed protein product [Microthlaspi erraticum]|uniref:Uncharacterized protein n=1 Tax=Microthlaspi erraticum TaxID=1685480 RepID=A0A6D2IEC7_9BRAS|nr:unnamed protein product [Microthlaspi erraticum]
MSTRDRRSPRCYSESRDEDVLDDLPFSTRLEDTRARCSAASVPAAVQMETVEEARARSAASRKAGIAERKRAAEIAEGKRKMSARDEEAAEVARKKKEAEITKEKKDAIAKERKASIAKGKRAAERAAVRQREKANPGGQGELEASRNSQR